ALSGLAIGALYWSGIKSGLAMDAALIVHEIAVNGSYFLILSHIAAALYHRREGDGIWDAMVPFWKERSGEQPAGSPQ
ncbi:MAG: cytochrome b/b6 domain-containing protein, partial [Pseudomonadota bacterium]